MKPFNENREKQLCISSLSDKPNPISYRGWIHKNFYGDLMIGFMVEYSKTTYDDLTICFKVEF
jgi:hypothetical protein